MANIKTAISIQEHLFLKAGAMARDMKLSRSRLFVVALEEFFQRHQSLELLERVNKAYDAPDAGDPKYRKAMRKRHRKMVEGQW